MGTLLKYLFYAVVVIVIYFVAAGFYYGRFTKDSTVAEVTNQVSSQTGETIKDGYQVTKQTVQNATQDK